MRGGGMVWKEEWAMDCDVSRGWLGYDGEDEETS
jgi:hypothetical protein